MRGLTPVEPDEFDAIAAAFTGAGAIRNRTIWILGCCTGYRISELLSLTVGDISVNGRVRDRIEVLARYCKRKQRSRAVALNDQAKEALSLWLAHLRRRPGYGPTVTLWPGFHRGWRPITHHAFRRRLWEATAAAGVTRRVSTHSMRKTFAGAVWSATGRDIRQTQVALGHQAISSTACYLASCDDAIESAVRSLRFGRQGGSVHETEQLYFNVLAFPDAS